MRTTARAILAVTTALTILVALATPASASTGMIDSGTASLVLENYVIDSDLNPLAPPPGHPPCAPKMTGALDVDFTTGVVTPGPIWSRQVETTIGPADWYWMNVSVVSGTFVITMPGATIASTLTLQITFHPIVGTGYPLQCIKRGSVCTVRSTITLAGRWSGSTASPPGTAVLSGGPANVTRAGACIPVPLTGWFPPTPPYPQLTISNLSVTF